MTNRYATLYGILLMLLNMAAIATSDISSKALRATMSSAHIVFVYKLSLLLIIMPWILSKGISSLKTDKIHIHLIRSLMSVLGMLFFVHGLHYVKMADAAALENLQSIALALIGGIFFKERLTKTKIFAVVLGFLGAIIVVNPNIIDILIGVDAEVNADKYYGFTLIGIGFWVMNSTTVKILGRTEKNKTQMFYLLFFACLWTAPAALIKWKTKEVMGINLSIIPDQMSSIADFNLHWDAVKFLSIMCICQFIHGVSYFKALKSDLSIIEPLRYTKLIFSAVLGYLMFQETPAMESYIGYGLIVISGLTLLRSEVRKVRSNK